jgi:hypothetical protein
MSPLSRLMNVFFSPGAVFDDVRRDPRGWLTAPAPWRSFVTVANMVYLVEVPGLPGRHRLGRAQGQRLPEAGPAEVQDKTIQDTIKVVNAIPLWQLELQQVAVHPVLQVAQAWFFTFVYTCSRWPWDGSWASRWARSSSTLAIVCALLVVTAIASGVLQTSAKNVTLAGVAPPRGSHSWAARRRGGAAVIVFARACSRADRACAHPVGRVARHGPAHRVGDRLPHHLGPQGRRTRPRPTSWSPRSLGLLMNVKGGVMGALLGELDLVRLWMMFLAALGLSRVFKKSFGSAAVIVFTPWLLWVVCAVVLGAVKSTGS